MSKGKIVLTLTVVVGAIAATTAPASAQFEGLSAAKGPIRAFPAETTFNISPAKVVCKNSTTTKATGFWNIQTSEETVVSKVTKEQKQPETKTGPHEAITVEKWGACVAESAVNEFAAEVSPCRLQVAEPAKDTSSTGALGSVQTNCAINIANGICIVTIGQEAANWGPEDHRSRTRGGCSRAEPLNLAAGLRRRGPELNTGCFTHL